METIIHLTPEDAALFVQFQKRYLFMKVMESTGAFDIRSGSVEIHFANTGEIASVDIHKHLRVPPTP